MPGPVHRAVGVGRWEGSPTITSHSSPSPKRSLPRVQRPPVLLHGGLGGGSDLLTSLHFHFLLLSCSLPLLFPDFFFLMSCFVSSYFLSRTVLLKTSAKTLPIFPLGAISLEFIPRWGNSRPKESTAAQQLLRVPDGSRRIGLTASSPDTYNLFPCFSLQSVGATVLFFNVSHTYLL